MIYTNQIKTIKPLIKTYINKYKICKIKLIIKIFKIKTKLNNYLN